MSNRTSLQEDMQQQIEDAAKECTAAFSRGSAPMMKLIAQKTRKGSVAMRVRYVLGGIRAMGSVDPTLLKNYFEALWERVPKDEEGLHVEAMSLVLDQIKKVVMEQTLQQLQAIADAMRLDEEVQFVEVIPNEGADTQPAELSGVPDEDDENRVLH